MRFISFIAFVENHKITRVMMKVSVKFELIRRYESYDLIFLMSR